MNTAEANPRREIPGIPQDLGDLLGSSLYALSANYVGEVHIDGNRTILGQVASYDVIPRLLELDPDLQIFSATTSSGELYFDHPHGRDSKRFLEGFKKAYNELPCYVTLIDTVRQPLLEVLVGNVKEGADAK